MRPDGSEQTRLTFHGGFDVEVAWSPDGSRLAVMSDRSGTYELWTMNADGSDQRQLTTGGQAACDRISCTHPAQGPAWSPDGSRLLYARQAAGAERLFTIPAEGGAPAPIPTSMTGFVGPDWQPAASVAIVVSGPRTIRAGARASLQVGVRNASPLDAGAVTATVTVPRLLAAVAARSTSAACAGVTTVRCRIARLPANGLARVALTVRARARGRAWVRAVATTSAPDAVHADNTATLGIVVTR
jgi:hypothetical protein